MRDVGTTSGSSRPAARRGADAVGVSRRRWTPGVDRYPFDVRRARLSERRRGSGEPAPDVHRVLRPDGTQERRRVHLAAGSCRERRFLARCCRSTTSSGVRTTRGSPSSSIRGGSRRASCRTCRWAGRSEKGRSVTLVISREWLDENGLPLKEEFRRALRVGPTELDPLDTAAWRIQSPAAGSRDGVVVTFPEPLDHGLLMRALGVTRDGKEVEGDDRGRSGRDAMDVHAARLPGAPALISCWRSTSSRILAGNQIGRAFEVDNFDTVDKAPTRRPSRSLPRAIEQPKGVDSAPGRRGFCVDNCTRT